ncbi:MAG: FAD/NAD(P)-binding protein [Myxococcota bacterium]
MNSDWLIIGGGIHGVHIAARLIVEGGVDTQQIRIVDPAERLLSRWRACTEMTGMTHLRSPSVHNIDANPSSLERFAGRGKNRKPGLFAAPYRRPSLKLFNAHCESVIRKLGLSDLHIRARATACKVDCDTVSVRTQAGRELIAENVVLAIGVSERPNWPSWALRCHPRVRHVFEPDFEGWPSCTSETVAVVGGGISAAQVALRLADEGHQVHLISRHALRQHQFDSNPGWLGPKYMANFSRERDLDVRRATIVEARHRGSVPANVRRALARSIEEGRVTWRESEVEACTGAEPLRLRLASSEVIEVQRVLLATGFRPERPGGHMVDELIASCSLPCARCGYPVVDAALRWHPRIHVSGALAELELGPVARNIAGARRAGDRIIAALSDQGHAKAKRAS